MGNVLYKNGFYDKENDGIRNFNWMSPDAKIVIDNPSENEWLYSEVGYPGAILSTISFSTNNGKFRHTIKLRPGWHYIGIPISLLSNYPSIDISISVDYKHQAPHDTRNLGIMVSKWKTGTLDNLDLKTKNSILLYNDLLRNTVVNSYPIEVTLESTKKCNLSCVMCSYNHWDTTNNTADFDFDMSYSEYVKPIIASADLIALQLWGEPLMSKSLFPLLDLIKSVNASEQDVRFVTNGTLLSDRNISKLLDSSLTHIDISTDAATSITYRKIRDRDFSKLTQNIKNLTTQKHSHHKKLNICLNMCAMRENINEVVDFVKLAHNLGADKCHIKPLFNRPDEDMRTVNRNNWAFYYPQQMLDYYPLKTREMLNSAVSTAKQLGIELIYNARTSLSNISGEKDMPYPLPVDEFKHLLSKEEVVTTSSHKSNEIWNDALYCDLPWTTAFIETNGDVHICCLLSEVTPPIGNIKNNSFMEIWNAPVLQEIRKCCANNTVHPLCKQASCSYVKNRQ
ncbi:radical SAM/SPASM domain-containing protein [Pectinatus haikarae]|uniref:MoaA/NifB/PqqE/SkfB family radical SAM enzyme n=1 Tax=Pectinatus haikarae TaxID=349096 RepID=A0ABT9Y3R4_9FIRM|nr:radical SAM protein [Pectinatus haikarae]MDQ0202465.1 MoaA/NifB/PqqE/SkfB family radical SAM enzyme [Pectinatus haikarae]